MMVQSEIASNVLDSYHIPVNVAMVALASDWTTRQKIAYWAIKECIRQDFLGLLDWQSQIEAYSEANPLQLSGPLSVIDPIALSNRLTSTTESPMEGSNIEVGSPLPLILGFNQTFTITPDQMGNIDELNDLVG